MSKLLVTGLVVTSCFVAGCGFTAGVDDVSTHTGVNEKALTVRGDWTAAEVVGARAVEACYWHRDHYDPPVTKGWRRGPVTPSIFSAKTEARAWTDVH